MINMALKNVLLPSVLACLMSSSYPYATASRELPLKQHEAWCHQQKWPIWRLDLSFAVNSFSKYIVNFFLSLARLIVPLNVACRTICTIMHECWPSMPTSLGLSSDKAKLILKSCCHASTNPPAASPVSS